MIRVVYPFETTFLDFPDNESLSVIIYCIGCNHNCLNCHNEKFKDVSYKEGIKEFSLKDFEKELNLTCTRNRTNKVVFSGGDFLFNSNLQFTKLFLKKYSKKYDLCIYTGYNIDYVKENKIEGFKFIKCGKYLEDLKQDSLKTDNEMILASKNQNFYNSIYKQISQDGILKF